MVMRKKPGRIWTDGSGSSGRLEVRDAWTGIVRGALRTPFRIASGQHDMMENVFLNVTLANGSTGWGEAGVATHITGETLETTSLNLRRAAKDLVGRDVSNYRAVCASVGERFKENRAGLAALEMAVLDAVARASGYPFGRHFGSRLVRCTTDITIVIGSVTEAVAATRRFYRRGFRVFKIKVGTDEKTDLERVRAVARNAPDSAILLDGNQGFDAVGMLRFLGALRRYKIGPILIEQPVPRGDWDGLGRLTRESGALICGDESVRTLAEAVYAIRSRSVHVVNVKFAKSGVLEAADIARHVRAAGGMLMMGAMLESALSITAAAQFAAGLGGMDFIDLDTTYFMQGPLGRSPYLDQGGRFEFGDAGPGIGVTPKIEKERGAVEMERKR
jgi:L-Ala-D/L-Glu epimerase